MFQLEPELPCVERHGAVDISRLIPNAVNTKAGTFMSDSSVIGYFPRCPPDRRCARSATTNSGSDAS
jgi:hypothetical protein